MKVELAVYDLSRGMAVALSQQILGHRIDGIWHTGVVVAGKEYYFGGGIQVSRFGEFAAQSNLPHSQLLTIGDTQKTESEIHHHLQSIRHFFSASTYDLINRNCNHFANELCIFLCGTGIPSYIVDLPKIVFSTPGGQMLRPMIESMQQGIQAQRGTMDPFAQIGGSAAAPSSSNPIVASALPHVPSGPPPPAALVQDYIVSSDASNLSVFSRKLQDLPGTDGVKGSLLSSAEKALLDELTASLTSGSGALALASTQAVVQLLHRLLLEQPTAQLAVFFLLRLLVLKDCYYDADCMVAVLDTVVKRLEDRTIDSVPVHVLAMSALVNCLSSSRGRSIIASSERLVAATVDIAMNGLSHQRSELRQMSSALASNLAITLFEGTSTSTSTSTAEGEVSTTAMQLLLGSLENLNQEPDAVVRKRKLSIACRIIRSVGLPAINLVSELDLYTNLEMLASKEVGRDTGAAVLDKLETDILKELQFSATAL